jgi:hypothetical protein
MINLERNPAYTNHNIPVDSDNYYRGVNADSYEALWTSDEDGNDIMQGYGKGGTDRLSFQAGHPNDLYVNGLVKANMILEGDASMGVDHSTKDGYSYVSQLERDKVESGETPLRVYMRRPVGGEAIHLVHVWDKVFDSFPETDSKDSE